MKKYNVNVNGNTYEVLIEEVKDGATLAQAPKPVAAPAAQASVPAGGEQIKSPMPGTILAVNVTNGASVKKGDVICILEAMKMENEILAPRDGSIISVNVAKGASVESGAVICVLG